MVRDTRNFQHLWIVMFRNTRSVLPMINSFYKYHSFFFRLIIDCTSLFLLYKILLYLMSNWSSSENLSRSQNRQYYPHFTVGETEVQRGEIIFLAIHSCSWVELPLQWTQIFWFDNLLYSSCTRLHNIGRYTLNKLTWNKSSGPVRILYVSSDQNPFKQAWV